MLEALLLAERAEKLQKISDILRGGVHARVEVGLDLEELRELFVISVQQIVEDGVSHEHDFDVQGDGLRAQALRCDEPQALPQLFDKDLATAQGALEPIPAQETPQNVFNGEH
jgi:hypothetical protein